MLHTLNQGLMVKKPNWQEGWLEGYKHQRGRLADNWNSGPPDYESAL